MGALFGTRQIGQALPLAVALLLAAVSSGYAEQAPPQESLPSWVGWLNDRLPFSLNVTGVDVEGGYRKVDGNRNSAKFQEYRILDENPFFDHARVSLETKDQRQYIEFSTVKPLKNDQRYLFRAGEYGGYELEIFWDQIPHLLSTTGRTLFTTTVEDGTARLTLPPGVASTVQAATPATRASVLAGVLANAVVPVDLNFLTSKGGFGLKYALSESLDMRVRYTYTEKDGAIPFGAGFGSPGGNVVELPAPFLNRTHQVEAKTEYARPGWNVGFGYAASIFDQGIDNITFDNPLSATSSPTVSTLGRTTMDPSNQAHNLFLIGGISLPLRTRIAGKFSYGWRLQDEAFVPHTINPTLATDLRLALPRSSLDGDIRMTLLTFNATSHPLVALPLTLSGGYRFYDFNNRTPETEFPAHTIRDTSLTPETRVNAPFSYTKHNAHLDAGYPLLSDLHVKLGYEWERWERDPKHREVPISDEHFLKTSFDYTPIDWLLFRAAYRRSWRSISQYIPQAHEAHVVLDVEGEELGPGVPNLQGQSILLRKFDEATRTRDRVEILSTITPIETLNFTATYSLLLDNFNNSALGLQESRGWSAGGDLSYSPFSWLSLFVNYMREEFQYDQISRSRPVVNLGTPSAPRVPGCAPGSSPNTSVCDFTDFNWRSLNTDTVNTYGAGADISLVPNRLTLRLSYSFSDADTTINSFNPVVPTSGQPVGPGGSPSLAAQQVTATAVRYPLANTKLHTLVTALRYNLARNWSLKAEYRYERFRETDWATDAIGQSGLANLPSTTDTFLGARFLQNYDAHIAAFTLRYQF